MNHRKTKRKITPNANCNRFSDAISFLLSVFKKFAKGEHDLANF